MLEKSVEEIEIIIRDYLSQFSFIKEIFIKCKIHSELYDFYRDYFTVILTIDEPNYIAEKLANNLNLESDIRNIVPYRYNVYVEYK